MDFHSYDFRLCFRHIVRVALWGRDGRQLAERMQLSDVEEDDMDNDSDAEDWEHLDQEDEASHEEQEARFSNMPEI